MAAGSSDIPTVGKDEHNQQGMFRKEEVSSIDKNFTEKISNGKEGVRGGTRFFARTLRRNHLLHVDRGNEGRSRLYEMSHYN
jgi:hypothetical protein